MCSTLVVHRGYKGQFYCRQAIMWVPLCVEGFNGWTQNLVTTFVESAGERRKLVLF